jgi:DNA polymerase
MRVHGVGSTTTGLLICGESPGYYESKSGTPFVGKTGDELNRYLDGETLPARSDWFLTNLYREYHSEEGYVYTAEDLAEDEPELLAELRRVTPSLIVPLGRYATRYFLGDVDMDSTERIPWMLPKVDKLSFLGDDVVVLPIIHPAAGLWNSEISPFVVAGFQALAAYLRGEIEPRELFNDPYPDPVYKLLVGGEVCHALREP